MLKVILMMYLISLIGCQAVQNGDMCFISDQDASGWTLTKIESTEALEMCKAAFKSFNRDPEKPHNPEYWFFSENGNALLCEPAGRYGCETVTWEIRRTSNGWESARGEMEIRLCH